MRRLALALATGAALSIGMSQVAVAAGLPVKAPVYTPPPAVVAYSWTGFYVGANIGYGWGDNDATLAPSSDAVSQAFWNAAFNAGAAPSLFALSQSGAIGGGQIGFNWQAGALVFGIEADIQGSNIDDSVTIATAVGGFVPGTFTTSQDLNWLATVRGRLGFAANRFLAYLTGGVAFADVDYVLVFSFPGSNDFHNINTSETETGWTFGGGFEWAFGNHWTAKAEYLYVDLGDRTLISTPSGRAANLVTTLTEHFENQYHIARVGLNYKFGGP